MNYFGYNKKYNSLLEAASKILLEQGEPESYSDHPHAEAASAIHDAWLQRNSSWASDEQKKPFRELSPGEQKKDIDQVELMHRLRGEHPIKQGESVSDHHHRLAMAFGSHAHDQWRSGRKVVGQNPDGSPRYEPREKPDKITGEVQDIANTPFHELSPGHRAENYDAGIVAARVTRPQQA